MNIVRPDIGISNNNPLGTEVLAGESTFLHTFVGVFTDKGVEEGITEYPFITSLYDCFK